MFDVIEKLKSEWTDRYVVIDSKAPELARFANATGTVKTVNMNGRCLVQFDQFNNIGWYDIDPSCLRIVTEPLPKPAEPAKAAKPAGESAKPAAAKPAAAKPAAAKPAAKGAGKPSTADILAAARAKSAAAGAAGTAGEPAAKKPATGGKPSTAEILARARAGKGAAAPVEPGGVEPASVEPAEEAAPAPAAAKPAAAKPAGAKKAASGPLPTTTAEKIAWCRQHDGGK